MGRCVVIHQESNIPNLRCHYLTMNPIRCESIYFFVENSRLKMEWTLNVFLIEVRLLILWLDDLWLSTKKSNDKIQIFLWDKFIAWEIKRTKAWFHGRMIIRIELYWTFFECKLTFLQWFGKGIFLLGTLSWWKKATFYLKVRWKNVYIWLKELFVCCTWMI